MKVRAVSLALALLGLLVAARAEAQSANYEAFILGERASAMGGAFTALADDGSAVFHNPAGLGQLYRGGLSLSANTYGYQQSTVDGALRGGGQEVDLSRSGALAFPNSLIYVLPLGSGSAFQHTAAFSVLVPDFYESDGVQNLVLSEAETEIDIFLSESREIYFAGPSYGLRLGDLYLGASAFAVYSSFQGDQSTTIFTRIGEFASRVQQFETVSGDYIGLTGVLGALYHISPGWAVGLRAVVPPVELYGAADSFFSQTVALIPGERDFTAMEAEVTQDVFRDVQDDVNLRRPWSFSLGTAWTAPSGLQLSLDLRLYLATDTYDLVNGEPRQTATRYGELPLGERAPRSWDSTRRRPAGERIVNGALGLFVPVVEGYAAMAGAFTDFSPIPDDYMGDVDRVDQFGLTLGVQRKTEETSFTLGLGGVYGEGESFGLQIEGGGNVTPIAPTVRRWTAMVFLSGSTPFGEGE